MLETPPTAPTNLSATAASERLDLYEGRLRPTLDSLRAPSSGSGDAHTWTRLGVASAFVNGCLVAGDVAVHTARARGGLEGV